MVSRITAIHAIYGWYVEFTVYDFENTAVVVYHLQCIMGFTTGVRKHFRCTTSSTNAAQFRYCSVVSSVETDGLDSVQVTSKTAQTIVQRLLHQDESRSFQMRQLVLTFNIAETVIDRNVHARGLS